MDVLTVALGGAVVWLIVQVDRLKRESANREAVLQKVLKDTVRLIGVVEKVVEKGRIKWQSTRVK